MSTDRRKLAVAVPVQRGAASRGASSLALWVLFALVAPAHVHAQEASLADAARPETRTVTAATRDYRASGFNRWLRGADYRELWQTPVEAPLLDLERLGSGLTPLFALGEGRGLAMRGADGRSYTFRALDKDLARTLPDAWYYTLPADLLQDQTVADHPAANLVVPELARAVGILRPATRLVVMPDSPRLGEHAAQFAGVLGTIEVYPTADGGFHGAVEILATDEFWEKVRAGEARPDARALLRIRLLDMLVGDWDRHREQFRWARVPGRLAWQPIPEDHDHAFVSYEGVALSLARMRVPRLVRFTDRIEPLAGLNEKGLQVDSWALSELVREDFVEMALEVIEALPDEVIERAVRTMPEEYHPHSAGPLARRLIARRDDLLRAASDFYDDLARQVDVWATSLSDRVDVAHEGVRTRVVVSDTTGTETRFARTFSTPETQRVRIHLGGGADALRVTGRGGVPVAVVAGAGSDRIESTSATTELFDVGPEDTVTVPAGATVRRSSQGGEAPTEPPWEVPRDRGSERYPVLWASLEPDASLFLGGGMVWQHHELRAYPYAELHRVRFGLAFGRTTPRFEYDATFRPPQSRNFFRLAIHANGLARLNYYGLGNETTDVEANDDFFEANGQELRLRGAMHRELGAAGNVALGVSVSRFSDSDDEDSLLATERPYGSGGFSSTQLSASWSRDTRGPAVADDDATSWRSDERTGIPFRGSNSRLRIDLHPALLDVESWFTGIEASFTRYLPVSRRMTLAARVGGRHLVGEFPWQSAAFLGGADSVRGYRPQRFAGRSSLFANLETRIAVGRAVLLVPGELGVFVHADVGRVWVDEEVSDRWHPALGGGFYFVIPELRDVLHLGVSAGDEGPLLHLGFGFGF